MNQYAHPSEPSSGSWVVTAPPALSQTRYALPLVALTSPPRGQRPSSLSLQAQQCCLTDPPSRIGTSSERMGPPIECRVGWPLASFRPEAAALHCLLDFTAQG